MAFCDVAIHSLALMANIKFKDLGASRQKTAWIKASWVNETCRDLQARIIKTASFCHRLALETHFPASYSELFPGGAFLPKVSPFHLASDIQPPQRIRCEG